MEYRRTGIYASNNDPEYIQRVQLQQQQQQRLLQGIPNMSPNSSINFSQPGFSGIPQLPQQQQYLYGSNTNIPNVTGNMSAYSHPQTPGRGNSVIMPPSYLSTGLGISPRDYDNMTLNQLNEEHSSSNVMSSASSNSPHGNNEMLDSLRNGYLQMNEQNMNNNNTNHNNNDADLYRDQQHVSSDPSSSGNGNNGSRTDIVSIPNSNYDNLNNNTGPQLSEAERKIRKKAQNRAAQKAFRERKENKMKELEEKLIASERNRQDLLREIDELKKLNMEISTENRILLQKNNSNNNNNNNNNNGGTYSSNSPENIAMDYDNAHTTSNFSFPTEDEFYETMVINSIKNDKSNKAFRHEDGTINQLSYIREKTKFTNEAGKQFLTIPATWDYLSELSKDKDFDIYVVMKSLKGNEICDEHGPSYPKTIIDKLIERSSNE